MLEVEADLGLEKNRKNMIWHRSDLEKLVNLVQIPIMILKFSPSYFY